MDTCHYTFVHIRRLYHTKSELWTLDDDAVSMQVHQL